MLTSFNCIAGQSVYDLVLNVYGTLNQLGKLIADNNITDMNGITATGDVILYDPTLVSDQTVLSNIVANTVYYKTGVGAKILQLENNSILQSETVQNLTL